MHSSDAFLNEETAFKIMTPTTKTLQECIKHETKRSALKKFSIVASIVIAYLGFSLFHYGLRDGFLATILTWSMFVLSTPIADAGFLIDFPLRLFTNIRMIYSESIVWFVAITMNLIIFIITPSAYDKTTLLRIFKVILSSPFPNWIIIVLSAIGTFLSIMFGDELMDVSSHSRCHKYNKHKNKHFLVIALFLILLTIIMYYRVLRSLGVSI